MTGHLEGWELRTGNRKLRTEIENSRLRIES
jgi:hypothetical protein